MMTTRKPRVLAAVLFGLSLAVVPGAADAGSDKTALDAEMHRACTELGGRFEQSWRYNDQGVQWGRVLSCSTSAGFVICQDAVCRSSHPGRAPFPAEPAALARAFAVLAEN